MAASASQSLFTSSLRQPRVLATVAPSESSAAHASAGDRIRYLRQSLRRIRVAEEEDEPADYKSYVDEISLEMVLGKGKAVHSADETAVAVACMNRKMAIGIEWKTGIKIVFYNVGSSKPIYTKSLPGKTQIVTLQWKSKNAVAIVTADLHLHEINLKLKQTVSTQLVLPSSVQGRAWEFECAAVQAVAEHGIVVALGMYSDRDVLSAAIKNGIDLHGQAKKAKLRLKKKQEEKEEEGDEFDEEGAVVVIKLDKERKPVSSAAYLESHSQNVNALHFIDDGHLMSGGSDGLVNIFDISKGDEDDALLTTVPTISPVAKLGRLSNGNFYAVTDDNKQILMKMNAIDDFDIIRERTSLEGRFLVDVVSGSDEYPIVTVESGPCGDLHMTAFDERGRVPKVIVRSFLHKDLIRHISCDHGFVCALSEDNLWSTYNLAKGPQLEEGDVQEYTVPEKKFKRQLEDLRKGRKNEIKLLRKWERRGVNPEENGEENGNEDGQVNNDAVDSEGGQYERKPFQPRKPFGDRGGADRGGFRGGRGGGQGFGGRGDFGFTDRKRDLSRDEKAAEQTDRPTKRREFSFNDYQPNPSRGQRFSHGAQNGEPRNANYIGFTGSTRGGGSFQNRNPSTNNGNIGGMIGGGPSYEDHGPKNANYVGLSNARTWGGQKAVAPVESDNKVNKVSGGVKKFSEED